MVGGRSRVVRSRVGSWLVGFVVGLTSVLNISDISTISIINTVGDSLDPAIGKGNVVASRGSISITSLAVSKVNSGVVISGSISKVVCWRDISVCWGRGIGSGVVWGRWASRGSHGNGHKGSNSNKGLKAETFFIKVIKEKYFLTFFNC